MTSLAGFGRPALVAALAFALLTLVTSLVAARRKQPRLEQVAARCLRVVAFFVALAAVSLVGALVSHDFSLEYVVNYSSRSLEGPYTLAALWGGMEGSLLLWTLLLSIFSAVAVSSATRGRAERISPPVPAWSAAVLATISCFFLVLLVAPADPFRRLAEVPLDGRGLNPLLQSPGMLIHPPLLYAGFVGFSIPFAFAMGALLSNRLGETWFKATRRWTLFAWSALSIGIVLGGAWAYTELGWGGYWAWDPVENASFMPWLTATAFLHSVVIQEKRGMFKVWNATLILLTYVLAVFGTFLTRSGLLSSIHTFTEGPIGKWFLPFLAALLIGGLVLVALRFDSLHAENRFDALLSRESAFLLNNVLFLSAAFTILWGTLYPIVAEAISGTRLSVGPPFFNSVFVPIGLALVALTGIGPLISWRRMSRGAFTRFVRLPLAAGTVIVVAIAATGVRNLGALLAFGLCAFTAVAVGGEFARGSRVYRRRGLSWTHALQETVLRNRRRYGGYIVHLGVVLIVIGFAGAAFRSERQSIPPLEVGDAMNVGAYTLTYERLERDETQEKEINAAVIEVSRGGSLVATLLPQLNFHKAQQQRQSEVAIRTTPVEDLYVVVTSIDPDGAASVRAFVNPLTWWIWMGAAVMAAGIFVLLSEKQPQVAPAPARVSVREPAVVTR